MRPHWRYRADHRWHYDVRPYLAWRWQTGRLRWAWLAIRQHCTDSDETTHERRYEAWYTLKVLVSMLFDRHIDQREAKMRAAGQRFVYVDYITVAAADGHTYPSLDCSPAYEWCQLEVAHSGLGYRIRYDTNC